MNEFDRVRELYAKLLARSHHVKVYLSYAKFAQDFSTPEETRKIYTEALDYFREKEADKKEERLLLLENWLKYEQEHTQDQTQIEKVK